MAARTMDASDETLMDSGERVGDPTSAALAQLPAAGALAELIVRSATDFAIVTSDAGGIITSWSPGAEKTMGWSAAQAVGRRVDLFFTPEDVASGWPQAEMDGAREHGSASDERWHMKADGSRFWASGEMQPLRELGEIVGFVKILRDRSEQRLLRQELEATRAAAASQLRADDARLREMFEAAPGFIAVFSGRDMRYDFVNASYQRLVGNRARVGITLLEALPEVAGQGYFEKLQSVYDSGVPLIEQAQPVMLQRIPGAPPELRYIDYVFQPMHDVGGKLTGLFLEGFDTTDAVNARATAEKLAAEQTAILGQLAEGVIATDADGRITFVNAAAESLHGVARLDVEPDAYADTYQLLTEDGAPYPSAELPLARAVVRGETVTEARWRIRRPDGTQVLAIGNAQPVIADGTQIGAVLTVRDDTARREAESALAASEARFQAITDSIDQMIWSTRPDGFHDYFNRRWYDYTGVPEGSTDGEEWLGLFHPDDQARTEAVWAESLRTGELYNIEYRLRHRSGGYRWVVGRAQAIREASGNERPGAITRWYGTCTDIHDAKLAQAAMRASDERYRTLFDAIDAGFCIIEMLFDDDGRAHDYRFVETNPAFERQTGLVNAVGKSIRHFAPDTDQKWIDLYAGVLSSGEATRYEDFFPGLDRWFDVNAFRVDAAETKHVAVLFNDVSERKRSELALTELNRTLETRVAATVAERDMIWRTSQDLFVVTGPDGVYQSVNPAWMDILGYEPAELIGQPSERFVHPDDLQEASAEIAQVLEGRVLNGLDLRMLQKDGGTRWISWTCVPQGDVFYSSGRDVTARKELEEQLRQSQKMEAVGQLTGGIAHDFNNLLTIVSGNIDMARRSLGADGDARALRSLGNAAKGADRAAALTQRLLAFSRRQPLQPRATDVNKLITGMTELLDRALGETVDLQVVAGAGLWRVEVDPNQLENAILNLAVNARDAMAGDVKPGGGKLTVETTNAHIDEAYAASQREVAPGQYVLISVTDTGEGMPPDVVAKAFDPFFSTKDVGKGTGLGLSQVYGYVKQSGGHVKIYSEPDEGTTIKLYLPRLIADMNMADDEDAALEAPTPGQESILVVEDDDDVRIYTVDSLRELGYRVLEAHDGASALRLLERQDEPPRLLLTDVVMPGMSGRDLADQARVLYPDMRILYTTGYARNAIVHGGRLDFGVELLPKPFTFEALAAKIRDVIDKSAVERALVVDPSDETREAVAAVLGELGFAAEHGGTVREALGKLRAVGGRFDVVILSNSIPAANLAAVLTELHAVRNDLPVLITGREPSPDIPAGPCIEMMCAEFTSSSLREALSNLRIRCSGH